MLIPEWVQQEVSSASHDVQAVVDDTIEQIGYALIGAGMRIVGVWESVIRFENADGDEVVIEVSSG